MTLPVLTLVVATIGMLFAIIGGISSWYNAFMIQRPWFKDHNENKKG